MYMYIHVPPSSASLPPHFSFLISFLFLPSIIMLFLFASFISFLLPPLPTLFFPLLNHSSIQSPLKLPLQLSFPLPLLLHLSLPLPSPSPSPFSLSLSLYINVLNTYTFSLKLHSHTPNTHRGAEVTGNLAQTDGSVGSYPRLQN